MRNKDERLSVKRGGGGGGKSSHNRRSLPDQLSPKHIILLQFKGKALKKDRLLENFQNSASMKPNDCGIAIYILYILENHKILIFQR